MSPRIARLLPLAIGPLCALALAVPASAGTARQAGATPAATSKSALSGYVRNSSSIPHTTYNSTGGGASITHGSTGQYVVKFPGLSGAATGNFQVTPVYTSNAPSICDLEDLGTSGTTLELLVGCWDLSGNPRDSDFTLSVTKPTAAPRGALAYTADLKPSMSYIPSGQLQYNSAHHNNKITHLGTGQYKVTMPGVGTTGTTGTAKVTAYSGTGGSCQLKSWSGTSAGEVIYVSCYSSGGSLADTAFGLVYAKSNNIMGQNPLIDANALDAKPTSATAFSPVVQYDSKTGAKVKILGTSTPGIYLVKFNGSAGHVSRVNGGGGDVQVSAQGSTLTDCTIIGWAATSTPEAEVVCFSHGGGVKASKFTVQWVTS